MTAMAQEYRRKPEVVQAVQWTGENLDEILVFNSAITHIESAGQLHIPGENGFVYTAWPTDWVVRNSTNDFYRVSDVEFVERYEVFV